MSRVRLTKEAELDLDDIDRRIAMVDPEAALRVVDAIEEKCRALAAMPGMGRARDDLAPGLRSSLSGKYLIFFRPGEDGIRVVRVVHGSRDLPSLFR